MHLREKLFLVNCCVKTESNWNLIDPQHDAKV
jgi:hypothetical protein